MSPHIDFNESLKLCSDCFILEDYTIVPKLEEIIKLKKLGQEKDIIERIPRFDMFIEQCLKNRMIEPDLDSVQTTRINDIRREIEKEIIEVIICQRI